MDVTELIDELKDIDRRCSRLTELLQVRKLTRQESAELQDKIRRQKQLIAAGWGDVVSAHKIVKLIVKVHEHLHDTVKE